VAASGSYTVQLRVASPGGAFDAHRVQRQHAVVDDGLDSATGGWQNWTTVTLPVNAQRRHAES
jgi:hypothetical protein